MLALGLCAAACGKSSPQAPPPLTAEESCARLCVKTASCTGTEDPGCVRLCVRNALHPRDLDTAVTRCAQLSCDAFVGCYREVLETARKERQRQE